MEFQRNGQNVKIHMYTEKTTIEMGNGMKFSAWTYDGTVPGPVLNLQQGDHVTLTLHNLDPKMSHSIDLHAALVAPNQAFVDVQPGKSKTIHFVASTPGVFLYHCKTQPMALHMAQGMYGVVIVSPRGQQQPTFTIVQSEFYKPMDLEDVINGSPPYVVFNGKVNRYVNDPLKVKVGQPVTVAFVNAGPNNFSAFHVVGSILRRVQASGNPKNNLYNVQTYTVAPGDGALIHLKFNQPGIYPFVSHSMASMHKGAVGKFIVTK
ncbi:MAG TPA: multicopper oxidase domain-containing protein [Bacillales bacterium]|nr:multicopper oxidase domain-containing protein [Bacillales bacterium]